MKKLSKMLPLFLLCGLLLFAAGCGRNKNTNSGNTNNETVTQQPGDMTVTDPTDNTADVTDTGNLMDPEDPDRLNNSVTGGISANGGVDANGGISANSMDSNAMTDSTPGSLLKDAGNAVNDVLDGTGDVISDVTGRR